jgi:hypothetical protein
VGCKEKRRLGCGYKLAVALHTYFAREARLSSDSSNMSENLRKIAEEIRLEAQNVYAALEEHIKEHEC